MTKYILSFLIISTLAEAQEVSVFGAGDLNSKDPYGLNTTEKHILKNQKTINDLSSKVGDVNSLINSLNRRLEGLESTYEGDSAKLNSTVLKVNELEQKVSISSDLASKSVDETQNTSNTSGDAGNDLKQSVESLKVALSKLTTIVNKMNSEYVSSNELKNNMEQFITREEFEAVKKALGVKTSSKAASLNVESKKEITLEPENKKLTSADKSALASSAKKDFEAKNYNSAIPKIEKLLELNYKPAENNFYLAEMWYVRKKYDLAVSHFKKSAMLNDKAAYMPTLLLHSAVSFEKTGDKENAKSFYSTLIDLYPNSSESKTAKQNLSKL